MIEKTMITENAPKPISIRDHLHIKRCIYSEYGGPEEIKMAICISDYPTEDANFWHVNDWALLNIKEAQDLIKQMKAMIKQIEKSNEA